MRRAADAGSTYQEKSGKVRKITGEVRGTPRAGNRVAAARQAQEKTRGKREGSREPGLVLDRGGYYSNFKGLSLSPPQSSFKFPGAVADKSG